MSSDQNSTRKSPRINKKSVERIIPIIITDDEDDDTPPTKQVDTPKKRTERKDKSSAKPEISITKLLEESKQTPVKSEQTVLQDNSDSSEGNEICVSVKQLTLSASSKDIDEETIKKENIRESKLPLLPTYNVPEKIIIVLDRARDEIFTHFELNNGNKFEPLTMLKYSLLFFLSNKNAFDLKHEYAFMALNENSATWLQDFTNDIGSIIEKFDDIEECETEDIFNINSVFDLINKKIAIPNCESYVIPPSYTVRTIFIYGRSFTMPEIKMTDEISNLLGSPYFTFDVLMTHETPDASNKCNSIFKMLQELDSKGFAYFFPVSRNSSELQQAMAKLLSHPLQRPVQEIANYKLVKFFIED